MKKTFLTLAIAIFAIAAFAQNETNENRVLIGNQPIGLQQIIAKPKMEKSLEDIISKVERLNRYENNFHVKLDSVTGYDVLMEFGYDSRFNCTKIYNYYYYWGEWMFVGGYEYAYDEQDRISSMVYIEAEDEEEDRIKEEYTYNEQNLITEVLESEWSGEAWFLVEKSVFEYDNTGNMLASHRFFYEDGIWSEYEKIDFEFEGGLLVTQTSYEFQGEWVPSNLIEFNYNPQGLYSERIDSYWSGGTWTAWEKTGYDYNEQNLCVDEITYYLDVNEWQSNHRYTYEYDDRANLTVKIQYNHYYSTLDWWSYRKTEYLYDDNNNCYRINYYSFGYTSNEWSLDEEDALVYDMATESTSVAGLLMLWDLIKEDLLLDHAQLNNKLDCFILDGDVFDFHYSSTVSVAEKAEANLTIHPNPVTEILTLNAEGLQQVEVLGLDGKQLMRLENGLGSINVSHLAKGTYLLKATFDDGRKAALKFVKE